MLKIITKLLVLLFFYACAASKKNNSILNEKETPFKIIDSLPIAFPTAEGYGKYSTGGRNGKVVWVTNLNDDGEGSFRKAATANFPRIIIFKVAGTIHLDTKLSIKANATIAGQTAPGDGICIADNSVQLGGDNIIVRYLRFRMGDKFQKGGMVDGNGGDDAFGGVKRKNIIIDHCSLSWSTDEVFSVYAGDSTTLQWNLISEPLNYSYHFETGDKDYEHHGFGAIWGGMHLTAHHNLFAHCSNRMPRFNGIRHTPTELVDYYNNVLYNWGGNNIYAGEGGNYNLVNNYYKYGPNTSKTVRSRIANPGRNDKIGFGRWYVAGNYVNEDINVTKNNWDGVHIGNEGTTEDKKQILQTKPIANSAIPAELAIEAYSKVLKSVGCSFARDTLDVRIIKDVINRTGNFIDVQGAFQHGTTYEFTINAWPHLKTGILEKDTDNDGMPDAWEMKNNLDPTLNDATKNTLDKQYNNIEVFINNITK